MTARLRNAWIKLVIAVIIDVADFFVGRVIGFGTAFDAVVSALAFALFGWKGLAYLWEVAELTDQLDGFVPTLSLIALLELGNARRMVRDEEDDSLPSTHPDGSEVDPAPASASPGTR